MGRAQGVSKNKSSSLHHGKAVQAPCRPSKEWKGNQDGDILKGHCLSQMPPAHGPENTHLWSGLWLSNGSSSKSFQVSGGGRKDTDMIGFAFQEHSGWSTKSEGDQNRSGRLVNKPVRQMEQVVRTRMGTAEMVRSRWAGEVSQR